MLCCVGWNAFDPLLLAGCHCSQWRSPEVQCGILDGTLCCPVCSLCVGPRCLVLRCWDSCRCAVFVLAALHHCSCCVLLGRFWPVLAREFTSTACLRDCWLGLLRCPWQALLDLPHVVRFAVSPRLCTARLPFLFRLHLSLSDRRPIRSQRRLWQKKGTANLDDDMSHSLTLCTCA